MRRKLTILQTEASPGWGGQEIRILREACGMRERGHRVLFCIQKGGGLVQPARSQGFLVYELDFRKRAWWKCFFQLIAIIQKHQIEVINTHTSEDAWLGGIVGRIMGKGIVRTRHLSTPIRKGLNSRLLYNWLADRVVTTCAQVVEPISEQANLTPDRCVSVPTGVDPSQLIVKPEEIASFRAQFGIQPTDCLIGTLCILRGWKGVADMLHAAKLLEKKSQIKWLIVGSGPSEAYFRGIWKELQLQERVIFTGHLSPPYTALAAMDIFMLLSTGNEGVSQASLQAAWLQKPLITTPTGGLKEVCLHRQTGLQVPVNSPNQVAEAALKLVQDPSLREKMGQQAKALVEENFTFERTLDQMEEHFRSTSR